MNVIFSFIWSAGANIFDDSRKEFSQQIRGKILKIMSGFPFEGDVYDYWPNWETKTFNNWNSKVTEFNYNRETPFFNILVPTSDTVKFKHML